MSLPPNPLGSPRRSSPKQEAPAAFSWEDDDALMTEEQFTAPAPVSAPSQMDRTQGASSFSFAEDEDENEFGFAEGQDPTTPARSLAPVAPAPTEPISAEPVAIPELPDPIVHDAAGDNPTAPIEPTSSGAGFSPEVQKSIDTLLFALDDDEYTEIMMNGPRDIMCKAGGARYYLADIDFGDTETYHRVLDEVILPLTDTAARVRDHSSFAEGQLTLENDRGLPPLLARVTIIAPPAVFDAKVMIAKKSRVSMNLDQIAEKGSMTRPMCEFLKAAAKSRLTTVLSGLSGTGKTTMMEAFSHHFDQNDRVIVAEDTPELRLPLGGTLYLLSSPKNPGQDKSEIITMEWLIATTNRMRPDRILVGEIRGAEMGDFLVAANSGADGSMTTIHAGDPRRCLSKIVGFALKGEGAKNEASIARDIANTIQLVVQLMNIDGRHYVTQIEEVGNSVRGDNSTISTTTLFRFNRNTGMFEAENRPSDDLIDFMSQRGVRVDMDWFKGR